MDANKFAHSEKIFNPSSKKDWRKDTRRTAYVRLADASDDPARWDVQTSDPNERVQRLAAMEAARFERVVVVRRGPFGRSGFYVETSHLFVHRDAGIEDTERAALRMLAIDTDTYALPGARVILASRVWRRGGHPALSLDAMLSGSFPMLDEPEDAVNEPLSAEEEREIEASDARLATILKEKGRLSPLSPEVVRKRLSAVRGRDEDRRAALDDWRRDNIISLTRWRDQRLAGGEGPPPAIEPFAFDRRRRLPDQSRLTPFEARTSPDEDADTQSGQEIGRNAAQVNDWPAPSIIVDGAGIPVLPDHLLDVPGLAGDIADWIVKSSESPQPVLAMGAALTLIGTIMGRKWFGPTQSSTALYALALAPTGAGKERPRQAIFDLLTAANLTSAAGAGNFTSSMAIEGMVVRRPITLNRIDEVGAFLKKVLNKRASSFEQEMAKVIRELWGIKDGSWQSIERAQSSSRTVRAPHFSIYATGVPSEVFAVIGSGDTSNGTINRFLLLPAGRNEDDGLPLLGADPPEHLVAVIKRITSQENDGLVSRWMNPDMLGEKVVIPFASDAVKEAYLRFKKSVTSQLGNEGDFRARTVEMAIRLATIRAFSFNWQTPVVTMDELRWGADLAMWSACAMQRMCADHMAENETQRLANLVRSAIRSLGGSCAHTALLRKLRNTVRANQLEETIVLLLEGGFVSVTADDAIGKRGRRARIYRLLE